MYFCDVKIFFKNILIYHIIEIGDFFSLIQVEIEEKIFSKNLLIYRELIQKFFNILQY